MQRFPILKLNRSKHIIDRHIWAPISTNIFQLTPNFWFPSRSRCEHDIYKLPLHIAIALAPKTLIIKSLHQSYNYWNILDGTQKNFHASNLLKSFSKKCTKWKSVLKPTEYLFCSSWASQGNMATSPSVTVMFLCKSVATDLETVKKKKIHTSLKKNCISWNVITIALVSVYTISTYSCRTVVLQGTCRQVVRQ